MAPFSFWFDVTLFLFIIMIQGNTLCNYVYEMNTTRSYPTNVCMELGSRSYIKYQCMKSALNPLNYTIIMQSFSDNQCSSESKIQEFDLNQWIITQNNEYNTSIQISYNCNGIDDCYLKYQNKCNVNQYDTYNYYPINQCLNNHNKSISFKYQCDGIYYEYDDLNCIESSLNQDKSFSFSTECIDNIECKSTPSPTMTPSPTITPSLEPTPSPTSMPSKGPTYYFPFRNKSLDNVVDILRNGTNHNSSFQYNIRFIFMFIVCIVTMILC